MDTVHISYYSYDPSGEAWRCVSREYLNVLVGPLHLSELAMVQGPT